MWSASALVPGTFGSAVRPAASHCVITPGEDPGCVTWVFVSAAATKTYPKRPQGAYCWLKAKLDMGGKVTFTHTCIFY